jgi:hypothetical protein
MLSESITDERGAGTEIVVMLMNLQGKIFTCANLTTFTFKVSNQFQKVSYPISHGNHVVGHLAD